MNRAIEQSRLFVVGVKGSSDGICTTEADTTKISAQCTNAPITIEIGMMGEWEIFFVLMRFKTGQGVALDTFKSLYRVHPNTVWHLRE